MFGNPVMGIKKVDFDNHVKGVGVKRMQIFYPRDNKDTSLRLRITLDNDYIIVVTATAVFDVHEFSDLEMEVVLDKLNTSSDPLVLE